MSKYFTKYLPVEGELKIGDKVIIQNTWVQTCEIIHDFDAINIDWNDDIGFRTIAGGQFKKVKLFLCSRDIQVGDTIKHFDTISSQPIEEVKDTVDIAYCIGMKGFKVIGKISDAATWITEKMKFEANQVQFVHSMWPPFEGNQIIETEQEFIERAAAIKKILIKCPTCGTFH